MRLALQLISSIDVDGIEAIIKIQGDRERYGSFCRSENDDEERHQLAIKPDRFGSSSQKHLDPSRFPRLDLPSTCGQITIVSMLVQNKIATHFSARTIINENNYELIMKSSPRAAIVRQYAVLLIKNSR